MPACVIPAAAPLACACRSLALLAGLEEVVGREGEFIAISCLFDRVAAPPLIPAVVQGLKEVDGHKVGVNSTSCLLTHSVSIISWPPNSPICAGLKEVGGREVCVYSISCKSSSNIDVTLKWLQAHAK